MGHDARHPRRCPLRKAIIRGFQFIPGSAKHIKNLPILISHTYILTVLYERPPLVTMRLLFPILAVSLLACFGCGESVSTVQGTLTDGGEALQVSDQGDIQIHFIQEENGQLTGQTYMTSVDSTGHFQAEVPEGSYRVAIQQLDPYPNVDKLKGKFDQKKTPIKQSIKSGDNLDIDLSQYEK